MLRGHSLVAIIRIATVCRLTMAIWSVWQCWSHVSISWRHTRKTPIVDLSSPTFIVFYAVTNRFFFASSIFTFFLTQLLWFETEDRPKYMSEREDFEIQTLSLPSSSSSPSFFFLQNHAPLQALDWTGQPRRSQKKFERVLRDAGLVSSGDFRKTRVQIYQTCLDEQGL